MQSIGTREPWVDTAKGVAIILVVVFHSVIFLNDIGLAGFWARLSAPLDTFRMPLFFFTAGIFAAKALALPLRSLLRRRVAKLLWLYAVWSLIWSIVLQLLPLYRPSATGNPLALWLKSFLWPNESTWFIYALAAYFVAAWLLRALHPAVQLVIALIPAIVAGAGIIDWSNVALRKMCLYFVFYLAAVHGGRFACVVAPRLTNAWVAVSAAVYAGGLVLILKLDVLSMPGVRILIGALGVVAGVGISVWLSRLPLMAWVTALGGQTLQVYLVHFYVVLGCVAAIAPWRGLAAHALPVWVPLVSAFAIVLSLGVYRWTRSVPGLWDLPTRTRQSSGSP